MGTAGSKSSEVAQASPGPSGRSQSACPLPEEARSKAIYNVYNQRIDGTCPQMVLALPVLDCISPSCAAHLMETTAAAGRAEQYASRAQPAALPWAAQAHLHDARALLHPQGRY